MSTERGPSLLSRIKSVSDQTLVTERVGCPYPMIRVAAYLWAAPNTGMGLAIGLLLGGRFRRVAGVIEVEGPRIGRVLSKLWVPAAALTLGHCVLGNSRRALERTRRHERVHVRQYERWGPAFIPTYLMISIWLYALGRDGYRENPFEREAYESEISDGQQD